MPEKTSAYEPMVLVDTADLPEDEWLEWRRRGIGGSDAAAILGVSPFATARDLYYDKLKVVSYEDSESNWVAKKVGHFPVGQKKMLITAILKKTTGKRNTLLGERIGKYLKAFACQNELKNVS